jgi:hypothetical protein
LPAHVDLAVLVVHLNYFQPQLLGRAERCHPLKQYRFEATIWGSDRRVFLAACFGGGSVYWG